MRVLRARYARRETADAGSVLGWLGIVFVAASILILVAPANAQESANVGALSATRSARASSSTWRGQAAILPV